MAITQEVGVSALNASMTKGGEQSTPSNLRLTADQFLKLFIKQLTTQNPLHPADSSSMLQQMADMSTISMADDNKKAITDLKNSINSMMGNTQFLGASQLIGKKVGVFSPISPLVKDEGLRGSVFLTRPVDNLKVTIKDSKGEVVKEIDLGASQSTGLIDFAWDGKKKDSDTVCEPGDYQISATTMVNGKAVAMDTIGAFKVNNVTSNPKTGDVYINVSTLGGLTFKDIIKIL